LEEFDKAIEEKYGDRTDALLDAMRKLIKELKGA
jgi:metal-responsive CopG/Arc/MetJ family transcriptional regulator